METKNAAKSAYRKIKNNLIFVHRIAIIIALFGDKNVANAILKIGLTIS